MRSRCGGASEAPFGPAPDATSYIVSRNLQQLELNERGKRRRDGEREDDFMTRRSTEPSKSTDLGLRRRHRAPRLRPCVCCCTLDINHSVFLLQAELWGSQKFSQWSSGVRIRAEDLKTPLSNQVLYSCCMADEGGYQIDTEIRN